MPRETKSIPFDGVILQVVWLAACALLVLLIREFNGGAFIYTLDDPYIHLAVAEEIGRGHYGVNPGEFSSPSSSMLWPFLLAPFARLPHGDLAPLALNILAGSLMIVVILRRLREWIPDREGSGPAPTVTRIVLTAAILLVSNAPGLVFTGMEHSLQLLLALASVDAMIAVAGRGSLRWWHMAAIVAGPLVRYENLAFTSTCCLLLLLERRWKPAIFLGLAPLLALAAFSACLVAAGLGPIPNSVMAKSVMDTTYHGLHGILLLHLDQSLDDTRGLTIALLGLTLSCFAWFRPQGGRNLPACLAVASLLHLMLGRYGWLHRYEVYMVGGLAFGLTSLAAPVFTRVGPGALRRLSATAVLATAILGYPYLKSLSDIPAASSNIYQQQYQMHRFVTESWHRPVAVNDLGWVSYRNDQQVLDLWGLASPEALQARLDGTDPAWLGRIVADHDIRLVMIYESWFSELPDGWIKVAQLDLSRRKVTAGSARVGFFATSPQAAREITELAREFRASLPAGIVLHVRGDAPARSAGVIGGMVPDIFPDQDD